jgi:Tfp pilus assembly protein PilN
LTSQRTTVAISDQPDWSVLFPILGSTVGDDVVLREIQLKPDLDPKNKPQQAFNLQLRGFSKTQPGVSQFVLRLGQLKLFDDVKLLRTGREPMNSGQVVTFEISCPIREGASAGSKP